MKKSLVVAAIFFAPLLAGATSTYWDYSGGVIQPLQSMWGAVVKGSYFQATSTIASILPYASTTAVSISSLTSGNCVQAGTGGLLTTTGAPCVAAGNYITALTGDVTASGPGSAAATIANNAVSYAKLQQVSANSLVGNPTGSTANAQAIATSTLSIGGNADTASKWLTARNLAGNSVDGSANVAFSNKFIVQGTTDTGLSGAQFLGSLGTGIVKNTTSTGVLSIAANGTDYSLISALSCSAGQHLATVTASGTFTCTSDSSGAVSSVSNSDGTLTISPTTGAVVASLNLGHENTWTGKQIFNIASTTSLFVGSTTSLTYPVTPLLITTNANTYGQVVNQNLNSGSSASADFIVGNDKSNDTSYYGDFGINSSTYSNASYTGLAVNDTYLYSNDAGLDIGTATSTSSGVINFLTGGLLTANKRMIIDSTGKIGIGTTTPWAMLSASSTIASYENTIATSTNYTVDWTQGNQQLFRIGTAGTTIGFSNYVKGMTLRLVVCNPPAASAGAITWSGVEWAGGTAPTQTTTAAQCDVWSFIATAATSTLKIFGAASIGFK